MTEVKLMVDSPETAAFLIAIVEEVKRAEAKHPQWPTGNSDEQVPAFRAKEYHLFLAKK